MLNDGLIKFKIDHKISPITISPEVFSEVTMLRTKLYDLQLIGQLPNGIGYGNLSIRYDQGHINDFFISGNGTGQLRNLPISGFAVVTKANIHDNSVESFGQTKASSESLSHGAIYYANPLIQGVVHVHSNKLWKRLFDLELTTPPSQAFGTPEIATSIASCLRKSPEKGIIVMGGHQDGIIAYGKLVKRSYRLAFILLIIRHKRLHHSMFMKHLCA